MLRSLLFVAFSLLVLAAGASAQLAPTPLLLEVHLSPALSWPDDDTYQVYRGGLTFLTHRAFFQTSIETCQVLWGVLTPDAYSQLVATLSAGRVGQQSGSCGAVVGRVTPSWVDVKWHGQNGRTSSFSYAYSDPSYDCNAGVLLLAASAIPKVLIVRANGQVLTDCPVSPR